MYDSYSRMILLITNTDEKPCNLLTYCSDRKPVMFDDWYMVDNLHMDRGLENVREVRDPEYDTRIILCTEHGTKGARMRDTGYRQVGSVDAVGII